MLQYRKGEALMVTVAMIMEKGGVGKTTTALELAFGLARDERRVLMIDLDPQRKLTNGLGLRGQVPDDAPSVYHVLVDELPIRDAIVPSPSASAMGRIDLVPGHRSIERAKDALEAKHELEPARCLERALGQLQSDQPNYYDVTILDCRPSLDFLTIAALLAADHVIVPMLSQQQAVDSLPDTAQVIAKARKRKPDLKLFGVLPTQFRRTASEKDAIADVKAQDLPVLDPIGISIRFNEAYIGGISIYDYDRAASTGYEKLVERFVATVLQPNSATVQ